MFDTSWLTTRIASSSLLFVYVNDAVKHDRPYPILYVVFSFVGFFNEHQRNSRVREREERDKEKRYFAVRHPCLNQSIILGQNYCIISLQSPRQIFNSLQNNEKAKMKDERIYRQGY